MEYIEGESLDKVMARRGRMTWEEFVALGQQLCPALQHAHETGHHSPRFEAVEHHGPARRHAQADRLRHRQGHRSRRLDGDQLHGGHGLVYVAGAVQGPTRFDAQVRPVFAGRAVLRAVDRPKPFEADNAMEMFMQHVQGTFERPLRMVLDIPVWLDTLVCQLLEKKPEQRPLDAHMVANTLGTHSGEGRGAAERRRRGRPPASDRSRPGQKRPDEEDKEAARILMTGKGKAKRKKAKKQLYEQVWLQAVGLLLALGVRGDVLVSGVSAASRRQTLSASGKVDEVGEHSRTKKRPSMAQSSEYLKHYRNRGGQQAKRCRAGPSRPSNIAERTISAKLHAKGTIARRPKLKPQQTR